MRLRMLSAAALIAGSIVACSANGTASGGPRQDRSVITSEELQASHDATLFDLVRTRRSDWLINRSNGELSGGVTYKKGAGSAVYVDSSASLTSGTNSVQVFVNGQHAGDVNVLRQFAPTQVSMLRYYSAGQATAKFGNGYLNGVIELTTK